MTDDTDVTAKGEFHLEFINEFDRLQTSSLPTEFQNGTRVTLGYGLIENVEISVGEQLLTLVGSSPRFVGGIGDSTLAVKYNFRREREDSNLPALTVTGYLQIPTGNNSRSLGSGVTDFGLNGIAQKTFKEKNVFRINGGYLFAATL